MFESVLEDLVLSDAQFRKISDLVYRHCGINLHNGKKELVRARLAKRLRMLHIHRFEDYLDYALNDPGEFTNLIDSLSTNLTSFFRESQHFDYLKDVFYPKMLSAKRQQSDFRIRAWSAGCSSGEEPYSIAISLLDAVQNQGRWDMKVLATDISTRVLSTAKSGVYEKERIEPLTPSQKQRYLVPVKSNNIRQTYEVAKILHETVIFAQLNLMGEWPIRGPVDFIFCRNVMIYFDKPTQEKLVNRYYDLLQSGGLLFTGHSESLTGVTHRFRYIQPTIYGKP
ncbi:MAG: protein-glutamate O-methyltransferase CheR [Sedimentisphaerales bacterium]|nr:protein-glutamate O-methyltransferase CheR [Sedimentisphaerales bacterium]